MEFLQWVFQALSGRNLIPVQVDHSPASDWYRRPNMTRCTVEIINHNQLSRTLEIYLPGGLVWLHIMQELNVFSECKKLSFRAH